MHLAEGAMVTSQLRLGPMLGKGGMGTIWAAHHAGLQRHVAVKFMSLELVQSTPDAKERFMREATVL